MPSQDRRKMGTKVGRAPSCDTIAGLQFEKRKCWITTHGHHLPTDFFQSFCVCSQSILEQSGGNFAIFMPDVLSIDGKKPH
uniref:Uncharacterized protein n=1 Tax=Romanomermis culicivorax TaxID=13658 RepID=A0A915HHR1_ROMCU